MLFSSGKERFQSVREAYRNRDVAASKLAHQLPFLEEHEKGLAEKFFADMVFASIDGIITTFAVVNGVEGAGQPADLVLFVGSTYLVADGFAMMIGNYLSVKSKISYEQNERARELWEMQNLPDEKMSEMRQVFNEKGLSLSESDALIEMVRNSPELLVDFMMAEELHIVEQKEPASHHALATWIAFFAAGSIPLIGPFLGLFFPFVHSHELLISTILTFTALFIVGALRARVTLESTRGSILQVMTVGGIAALVAYITGWVLSHYIYVSG